MFHIDLLVQTFDHGIAEHNVSLLKVNENPLAGAGKHGRMDLKNLKPGDVSAAPVSGRFCLLLPVFDQSSGFRFSWTHAS